MVQDIALLYAHNLRQTLRNPVFVIVGLFQPICQMLLYAPLLNGLPAETEGIPAGQAFLFFTPGALVLLAVTSALYVGFGFIADLRAGVLERMRVTPVSRVALILSRSLRDVTFLLAQSFVLLITAWLMGMRAGATGIALALLLVIVIGLATSSFSYALALMMKDENAVASVLNLLLIPILLLSGITLPIILAPQWLRNIAAFNPFLYSVDGTRALFYGQYSHPDVAMGFGVMGALALLCLFWAVRTVQKGVA